MNFHATCEGYWKGRRCRNKAAFKHVSEIGEQPAGGGFSFVARIKLCKRCSERMDLLLESTAPGYAGPTRPGLVRESTIRAGLKGA